jgi:hypothetical protein
MIDDWLTVGSITHGRQKSPTEYRETLRLDLYIYAPIERASTSKARCAQRESIQRPCKARRYQRRAARVEGSRLIAESEQSPGFARDC